MRRRSAICIAAVALGLFVAPCTATAAPATKAFRIGWLGQGSPAPSNRDAGDFEQGLRDVGYTKGQNVVIEYRYADGNVERLALLATELVRLPVDVIVTSGEQAAFAAKRATRDIPIVATDLGLDPVKAGLVASLGRPGGNITGLATLSDDLWPKRLGLLKEVTPRASRLAVLGNPANSSNASCFEEIKAAASATGLRTRFLGVSDEKTLAEAFAGILNERPEGLVICWDSVTLVHAKAIADFALKQRLPTLAPLKEYVVAGALLSFGARLPAQRRRTAYYVDKILKGVKPADLPVERPTLFELVVNLPTAKALGLALPAALVVLADVIVE